MSKEATGSLDSHRAGVGCAQWAAAADAGRPRQEGLGRGAGRGGWSAGRRTASDDRAVRVWDARTGQQEVVFSLGASAAGIAVDQNRLAVASDSGVLVIEHRDVAQAIQS